MLRTIKLLDLINTVEHDSKQEWNEYFLNAYRTFTEQMLALIKRQKTNTLQSMITDKNKVKSIKLNILKILECLELDLYRTHGPWKKSQRILKIVLSE